MPANISCAGVHLVAVAAQRAATGVIEAVQDHDQGVTILQETTELVRAKKQPRPDAVNEFLSRHIGGSNTDTGESIPQAVYCVPRIIRRGSNLNIHCQIIWLTLSCPRSLTKLVSQIYRRKAGKDSPLPPLVISTTIQAWRLLRRWRWHRFRLIRPSLKCVGDIFSPNTMAVSFADNLHYFVMKALEFCHI